MIDTIQKKKVSEKILKIFYRKGEIPDYKEFKELLDKWFKYKRLGQPFFVTRGAARGQIVDPKALKDNIEEIKEDLDTAFEDAKNLSGEQIVASNSVYGEFSNIRQRLNNINEELESLLFREGSNGSEILFDNFRNTDKIDLKNTTAFVDTNNGFCTLPISINSTVKYSPSNIKIVKETISKGGSNSKDFSKVFSDYVDEVWYASLPDNGYYQVDVNVTGKEVIEGHTNEVEINRISIDPISNIIITIDGSVDGLNWFNLGNGKISSAKVFELEPTYITFLRFTLAGSTTIGIRRIEIGKVGTADNAVLISKKLSSDLPIYDMQFSVDQELPTGTSISHYIFTGEESGWRRVFPGFLKLDRSVYNTIKFGSNSYDFLQDTSEQTSLWKYGIDTSKSAIQDSAELLRGLGQWKVSAFYYNYDAKADPNHIPDISDWQDKDDFGNVYMQSIGSTASDAVPNTTSNKSFLFTYVTPQQTWWGAAIKVAATGNVLINNYSYKLTSYLYSDRDVLLDNFAGGVYVRDPSNSSNTPTVSNTEAYGWSFYVNDLKVASENKFYTVSIPGSGSLTATQGKSFPISIKTGWNKLEVLIYMPSSSAIDSGLNNYSVMLLFRPNLFSFDITSADQFAFAPKIGEYPIWADGRKMSRVSEFYLKWNTPLFYKDNWAWRISTVSGTATHVLLNYNPYPSSEFTIDSRFKGSEPAFNLRYTYSNNPITALYYKAELNREQFANQPPKINNYRFLITR